MHFVALDEMDQKICQRFRRPGEVNVCVGFTLCNLCSSSLLGYILNVTQFALFVEESTCYKLRRMVFVRQTTEINHLFFLDII